MFAQPISPVQLLPPGAIMLRRFFSLSVLVICGTSQAQSVEHILTLKTAGQPPRQVKVLKTVRTADGVAMTDLKDLNSGEVFSLTDSQLKYMTSGSHKTVPTSKPRTNDPLLPVLLAQKPEPVISSKPIQRPVIQVQAEVPATSQARVHSLPIAIPAPLPVSMPVAREVSPAFLFMQKEIQPFTHDLANALRPTVRMDAATVLAEGRYCSRPEVKAELAKAAEADPAPIVRVHCIACLSKLGHAEPDYVKTLEMLRGKDQSVEVRRAAAEALRRLQPQ